MKEQLTILKNLKCDRAQGHYLARPVLASDIDCLIARGLTWEFDRSSVAR